MRPSRHTTVLRGAIFGDTAEARLLRAINQSSSMTPARQHTWRFYTAVAAAAAGAVGLLLWLAWDTGLWQAVFPSRAGGETDKIEILPAPAPAPLPVQKSSLSYGSSLAEFTRTGAAVQPIVPAGSWREMEWAEDAPLALKDLSPRALPFDHQRLLPSLRIDGAALNHRLPEALWVKLEQPGNACALVETDEGTFVKILEEVTPGYVSRCAFDSCAFGTLAGDPAEADLSNARVRSVWIVQDAAADLRHVPGWVAVSQSRPAILAAQ